MSVVHFCFLQRSRFLPPLGITQPQWMKLQIALE
jgi:hypothetical protein